MSGTVKKLKNIFKFFKKSPEITPIASNNNLPNLLISKKNKRKTHSVKKKKFIQRTYNKKF